MQQNAGAAAAAGTPTAAARQQLAGLEAVLTEIMDGRTSAPRKREIGKCWLFSCLCLFIHPSLIPL